MSSPTDESVQPAEPDASERIPLAPIPPAAPDPRPFIARLAFLDGVLVLLVAAFAFLAACTRIGNSDLFLHLAAGRLIAQGQFPFLDPFTFTAAETAWVNQSWLFDLLLYLFHRATGPDGEALTLLKAAGFAVVALLMVRAGSKPGERLWIPAFCAMLAALALSPRSLLSPVLASLLVLGGLMTLMARHRPGSRALLAAPALCLLWANLDAWFFLGPLLMGLFALGRYLDLQAVPADKKAEAQVDAKQAAIAAAACLLACLANPFLWNVFASPPPELARYGAGAELAASPDGDPQFRGWQLSVWDRAYYSRNVGLSPAGLAFFPLVLLSLASFAAGFPEIRWGRVLPWLAMLALSLLSVRAVPFFAVVAGPVMALNFLDASERLLGPRAYLLRSWRTWAVSGRVLTAFIGLSLCLLSVPGWLQAMPQSRYRAALGIEHDEGLRAAALKADEWRKQGASPAGQRWFNLSPEAANYFAWFCPGERTFLDQRLPLFRLGTAQEFRAVRRSLQGLEAVGAGEDGLSPMAWRRVLEENGVRWLVFNSQSLDPAVPTLLRLYSNPDEWTPCFVSGRTALFAWRGPRKAKPSPLDPRLPADFEAEAFGPEAVPAPDEGPSATSKPWYLALLEGEAPPAPSAAYAQQQLLRFEASGGQQGDANDRAVASILAASLVGRASSASGAALLAYNARILRPIQAWPMQGPQRRPLEKPAIEDAFFERAVRPSLRARFDAGPPSALYLGLRAAREANARNPQDAATLLRLSECYGLLGQRTREGLRSNELLPHLRVLRQTQVVAPLQAALRLATERHQRLRAHAMLANAFSPNEYLDLHVLHLGEFARLCREQGGVPGVPAAQAAAAMEGLDKELAGKKKRLDSARGQFEVRSAGKPTVQRATLALSMGLPGEAIAVLEKAKPEDMGLAGQDAGGLQMLVHLLLATGRLDEARSLLVPAPGNEGAFDPRTFGMHPLGMPAHGWFVATLSAASGDYAEADKALARLAEVLPADPSVYQVLVASDLLPSDVRPGEAAGNLAQFAGAMVAEAVLRGAREATRRPGDNVAMLPFATNPPHRYLRQPWQALLNQAIQRVGSVLQSQADLVAIRAALALEQGRMADARKLAIEALDLGGGPTASRFRSAPYAALVVELADSGKAAVKP